MPCACLAWLLPLLLGVWSGSSGARWQDDQALLRDLGLIPAGSEGALSSVLSQLFALAPVGSRCLRAGLVGVSALAVCSAVTFSLLRQLLDARRPFAANSPLALLGSQLWALSPLVLRDTSAPGSAALGLLTILLGVRLLRPGAADARVVPLAGALLGLSWGESHTAALVLLGVLLAHFWSHDGQAAQAEGGELPWLRFLFCFALGAGSCALVPWLRSWAPHTWLDLGLGALPLEPRPSATAFGWRESARQALAPPLERLGAVAALLALAGALVGLVERGLRRRLVPWAALALAGLLGPLVLARQGTALALCALCASVGLAAFVPLGLQAALAWLWSRPVPFARPACVLSASFAVTLVLQRVESAVPSAAPSASELATEAWTDEALGRLPVESVLVLHDPALALRLWSAQLLQGARPDVVLVPLALLQRGSVSERLLERAPELKPLLRQLAVNGEPDEYALGRLADARPLFLELDSRWDERLREHLSPDALWLAFAPQPLDKSDRRPGVARARAALARLLDDPELEGAFDERTRRVLAGQAGQQALLLAALGETLPAQRILRSLQQIRPEDPLARALAARLEGGAGRVAVNDLLAGAGVP